MPRLILMRHAKSSWDDLALDDHARPLNKRGRASAKAMGAWLRAKGYVPASVLCSSAQRTRETWTGLAFDAPVVYLDALYHASPDPMMTHLRKAGTETVLMIGHNPGIAMFAHMLLREPPAHPRFDDYPTCATMVADFEAPWPETEWKTGTCIDFAIPREVIAGNA